MVLSPPSGAGDGGGACPRRRVPAVAAALALLAGLLPGTAGAVVPPRPSLLPLLAARCDSAGLMRIVTARSTRFAHRVRLEPDAVVLPGPARVAFVQLGEPPETRDTRIPWAEVENLALGRSRTGQGLLTGSLVGAALGGALIGAFGSDLPEHGDNAVLYSGVVLGVACAGLGAILGAGHPEWTPLYP